MIVLRKLKAVALLFHGTLMFATFMVCFDYFSIQLGRPISTEVPEVAYTIVGLGVVGVSIASAFLHILGGGVMGATAGGVLTGMRIGFLLGIAYGFGRLWMYAGSALAASILFWPDNKMYTIGLGVATVVCFVTQMGTKFVWAKLKTQ